MNEAAVEYDYRAWIGEIISERQRQGISQERLARMVDVSRETIWNIENFKNVPSFKLFLAMALALNMTIRSEG